MRLRRHADGAGAGHGHNHEAADIDAQAITDRIVALTLSGEIEWTRTQSSNYFADHEGMILNLGDYLFWELIIRVSRGGTDTVKLPVKFTRRQAKAVSRAVKQLDGKREAEAKRLRELKRQEAASMEHQLADEQATATAIEALMGRPSIAAEDGAGTNRAQGAGR